MSAQQQLVWIDGATGAGKTSLASALKEQGWIMFEGDAFFAGIDPTGEIQLEANELSEQHKRWVKDSTDFFMALWAGITPDADLKARVVDAYEAMCSAVLDVCRKNPAKSVAIARAVYSSDLRALVKERLGPDLKWVLLTSSNEWLGARIEARFIEQGTSLGKTLDEFIGGWPAEIFPEGVKDRVPYLRRTWWYRSMSGFDFDDTMFGIHVDDDLSKDDVKEKTFTFLGLTQS